MSGGTQGDGAARPAALTSQQAGLAKPACWSARPAGWVAFVHGLVSIGALAAVAMATGLPAVFPSLGPTAILLSTSPSAAVSRPWNVLVGHAIGILCGFGALWALGLAGSPPAMETGVTVARVAAAAFSLAATSALLLLARSPHPPAGATTLIVSLGLIRRPADLCVMEGAVALLLALSWALNRVLPAEARRT